MYKDRFHAAHKLAAYLENYKNRDDVIILAIPRGALEIGSVLAQELNAPLDVIFTKKLGAPENPELAIGTVSMDTLFVAPAYKKNQALSEYINKETNKIRKLLAKRIQIYRAGKSPLDLRGKTVILVDDGVATGHTLSAAIDVVKKKKPKYLIVAVPVGPRRTIEQLTKKANLVICPLVPTDFFAISQFYQKFPQVEDEQAIELLQKANLS